MSLPLAATRRWAFLFAACNGYLRDGCMKRACEVAGLSADNFIRGEAAFRGLCPSGCGSCLLDVPDLLCAGQERLSGSCSDFSNSFGCHAFLFPVRCYYFKSLSCSLFSPTFEIINGRRFSIFA